MDGITLMVYLSSPPYASWRFRGFSDTSALTAGYLITCNGRVTLKFKNRTVQGSRIVVEYDSPISLEDCKEIDGHPLWVEDPPWGSDPLLYSRLPGCSDK